MSAQMKIGYVMSFAVKCAQKCNFLHINATFVENKCNFLTFLLQQKLALLIISTCLIFSFRLEVLISKEFQNVGVSIE